MSATPAYTTLAIPPGAIPIVRNAQATGTLYTVPANRRLYITHAWVSAAQKQSTPAAGFLEIIASALIGDANARVLIGCALDANGADSNGNATGFLVPVPLPAAATVALTLTAAAGASVQGGFQGFEVSSANEPGAGAI